MSRTPVPIEDAVGDPQIVDDCLHVVATRVHIQLHLGV
jgi:hypothetical protein